jgi:hypothetical protein
MVELPLNIPYEINSQKERWKIYLFVSEMWQTLKLMKEIGYGVSLELLTL